MKQVFVGNLKWEATDDDVRRAFESENIDVSDVRVMKDQETGKPRGYAFVTLDDVTDTDRVIEKMHEYPLLGRPLHVEHARGVKPRQ